LQLDAAVLPAPRGPRLELGWDRPPDIQPELHDRRFCRGRTPLYRRSGGDDARWLVVAAAGGGATSYDQAAGPAREASGFFLAITRRRARAAAMSRAIRARVPR